MKDARRDAVMTSPSRRAFERLYRENFAFVWAAARRLGVPSGVLDDATQDVFVTAFRKLDELRTEVSPRGWLYGVTRRVAHRYRRGLARRQRRHTAYAHQPHLEAIEPHGAYEARRWLRGALRELDSAQRETFVMAELLGMSGPEIAAHQDVALNTVYSRLRLARQRLLRHARSTERLHEAVGYVRRADTPEPEQRQRVWVAMMPAIDRLAEGIGTAAVGGASVGSSTVAWIGAAIVAAGVTAFALAKGPLESEVHATTASTPQRGLAGSERSVRAVPREASPPSSVGTVPLPPESARPVPSAPPESPTRPRPKKRDDPESARSGEPSPPAALGLAEELELLDRAQRALDRGAAREALAWATRHAETFANGQLADVREAARIDALCRLGRIPEAKRAHDALREHHSGSNVFRGRTLTCW